MGAKAQDTEPAVTAVRDRNAVGNRASLTDAAGNQVAKADGTDAWTYAFDYRNRMAAFDGPGTANDATYVFYPHHWARRSRTVGTGEGAETTRFLYDGDNDVAEYDAAGNVTATYVTPFLDQNVSMTIPAGQPDAGTYFYMHDGLGSVRNLLDASQVEQNRYDYEAFGQQVHTATAESVPQPFTFTARRTDAGTGMMHFRRRQLGPDTGRFASRDPIGSEGGSEHLYAYVANAPTRWSDPLGLELLIHGAPGPAGTQTVSLNDGRTTEVMRALRALCPVADPMVGVNGAVVLGKPEACKEPKATGCCCLCDVVTSSHTWTISPTVADPGYPGGALWPGTKPADSRRGVPSGGKAGSGTGGVLTTTTARSKLEYGAYDPKGVPRQAPDTIILAHELCGHAWPFTKGTHDPRRQIPGNRPAHDQAINIENQIRAEQGIGDSRGLYRDPERGESAWRPSGGGANSWRPSTNPPTWADIGN